VTVAVAVVVSGLAAVLLGVTEVAMLFSGLSERSTANALVVFNDPPNPDEAADVCVK
jgi:hypothetical protein